MEKIFTLSTNLKKSAIAFLSVLFCLVIKPEIGLTQTTVTINSTGTTGSYNSGYVTSGGTKTDGNIIADGVTTLRRGWASFDLSSIPVGSVINSVTIKFTVTSNNAASGVANQIYGFAGTPSAIAGSTLYTNCGSGTAFYNNTWTQNSTNSIAFNPAGVTFITGAAGGSTNIGFVRGAGSSIFNINGYPTAPQPQLVINYTPPPYRVQFSNLSANALTSWCAGETRSISLTVKNLGSASWLSGGAGVNFSYWWSNQSGRDANPRILPFTTSLVSGGTQILTFNVTAPANGTPTLNFDLVREGSCWFADNVGGCSGPGNTVFSSPGITISSPTSNAGSQFSAICVNSTTGGLGGSVGGSATGGVWSSNVGGTFNPNANTLNATWTPALNYSGTAVLTLTTTSAGGCTNVSSSKNQVVNAIPTATAGGTQTICSNGTATVSGASSSNGTILWTENGAGSITGGATTLTPTYTAAAGDAGNTVTLTMTVSNSPCAAATATYAIVVNGVTSITTQPVSNQTVCTGGTATFSVIASGTAPLSYQWKKGGVDITGETNASYTITSLSAGDAASYTVVVTNTCNSITSNAAVLIVSTPASITTDPVDQSKCAGSTASFSVAATGGPLTYQWQKNNINIAGANAANYTTPALVAGDNGATYKVIVTSAGCGSVTSAAATLTVNTPVSISNQPVTQTICAGSPVTFSVATTGTPPLSYQWKKGGVDISGETSSSYTIASVSAADAGSYTVTITNACNSITSNAATLTVNTAALVTTDPVDQTRCVGQTASFSVVATGGPLTYQWQKNNVNIAGANAASYTTPVLVAGDNGATYKVIITVTSCGSVTSASALLTVNTPSSIITQPAASQTICLGTSATFSVVAGGTPAPTYQWKKGGTNISGATGSTYTIASVSAADAATYTVVVTNTCGSVTSSNAVLTTTAVGSWIGVTSNNWFIPGNWGCGQVPDATIDVTIPASAPNMPSIGAAGAVCKSITNNGTLTITGTNNLDVYGDWMNNGTFTPGTGSITFKGSTNNTMAGSAATLFYNLIVNKGATANTITSSTKAFTSTGSITVTQGDLILTANDVSYAANNITVPAAGILTDNVNWDGTHLLSVTGNIAIDGIFNYTSGTPHVNMNGAGAKTVRSGINPASGFGFLTLSTGDYTASGQLTINSNFWAMFGTAGSFTTGNNTVTANAALLIDGGTTNINGGTVNVTGGLYVGYAGLAGVLNFGSGTINADFINVGDGTLVGTLNHSGGTANIGNLLISSTGTYTASNSPIINITGNWTNNKTFTPATSQVNFNGSVASTIGGSIATTFYNLSIANAAGVNLGNNENVSNVLNLSNGLVTTAANTLTSTSTSAAAITGGSATSYVNGKLARGFAAGAGSKIFPIGKGGNYRPLTFTYTASGAVSTITAEQFEAVLAGTVTPATVTKDIRYWEITKNGTGTVSYTVTLDPTYTPTLAGSLVQIIKKEGNVTATALTATLATTPNYTNGTPFTTFNNSTTAIGVNDFALGSDCSSTAIAGAALTAICQGSTSAALGGSVSGTATGGTWSDGGVGGTFNPNAASLNATWTPPAAYFGTVTFTLTPTGGICTPNTTASKTLVVNGDATIALASAAATTTQTVCINAGITAITYQLGGGATGANLTGAPAGVTGSYNTTTKVYTVSGAPTAPGNFTYTVTTTGPCIKPALVGTISVTPDATIILSSAAGTNVQTVCQNTAITTITYAIGGSGTGVTPSGLPAGLSLIYSGGTYTISGSPTASGTFNYTVTTTGPCAKPALSGTITVLAAPSGTFTSTETSGTANDNIICTGTPVTFTAPSGYNSYTFYVNGTKVQGPNTTNTLSISTLPNNASVTVDVANTLNCGTTFGPIIITVIPAPAATLVADKASICPGDMVTFTAGGGTSYNFKLNGSSVQSGSSNTYSTTSFAAANSPVTVDVTNTNGCIGTSAPVSVTVNPLPSGTLTSTANSICAGGSVTFTATAGFAGYNFKVNGTSVQNNGSNIFTTTTLANPSVVTVDVTNASTCTTTFNAIAVTVNPLPTGTLTAVENSGTANDNNICANSPVTFTATSGYSNYDFQVNGVSKQSSNSNTYTNSSLADNDVITVSVKSGSNCSVTFNSITITVVASPAGTLTISPSNTICAGDNVTFTADAGYSNYNFKINGATAQNGSGNTYTTTGLMQSDVVTVEVTNTNSCVTTFNSITMTVNPLPTGILIAKETSGTTPDDGIICTGSTIVFTAPTGFSNYNFIKNNISVQSGASNTYTPASGVLVTGDEVKVALTNGSCIGLTNTVTITINPLPAIAPITGTLSTCETGTTTLGNTTAGGTWSSADMSIATVNATTGVVTGVAAGIVNIIYTTTPNGDGCTNSTSASVTVNAPPTVAPIAGNVNVCTGTTSQFSDATTGITNVWGSDNMAVATVDATTGLVSGVAPGTANISYTVTDANGCSTTVYIAITVSNFPSVPPITTTASSSFNVCVGGTIALKDATSGGTWSSSDMSVATVSATGVVTGLTSGTTDITYSITTTCNQPATATQTVTVNAPPSATISYNSGNPFCTSAGPIAVSQTGTTGGTYTATGGLSIDPSTGTITPGVTGGTYTISYKIAAAGGCGLYTTTTSVTITTAPSATITYAGPYCTTTASANVTMTGTAGGTYTSTTGLSINAATGAIAPASSTAGAYTVTYTIAASGGCALFSTTAAVTITAAPSATISYTGSPLCKSLATAAVTFSGTAGGTYSSTTGLTINSGTGAITPSSSTAGTYTVTYTVTQAGGCSAYTTTASVTVTPTPTAVAGTAISTCSNTGAVDITTGSSATNYSSVLWTSNGTGTFANANSLTTATYTPSAADITAGSRTLTLTVNGNGSCTAVASTKTITISAPPTAPTITPASATICQGSILPLSAGTSPSTSSASAAYSGAVIAIPDNSSAGAITALTISGIPATATINNVSINFNITHTYDGDLRINLKAPNGNVLNLADRVGGGGNNFTNTTINSLSATPLNTAPFGGTYAPDGDNNISGATSGGGNTSNVTTFAGLYSVPNGTWIFSARDVASGDVGTINNWSITINYTVAAVATSVTWSPSTDLFTDAGATISYTSQALTTVYAKPSTPTNRTYTATATNGNGCTNSSTVTIAVNPSPVVSIIPDYCAVAGKVQLTATSTPAGNSYLWSTGETTQTILVDVAGTYKVAEYFATGCSGKATIDVASELVTNGDFEAGDNGFSTLYASRTGSYYNGNAASGLYPEGDYAIDKSAYSGYDDFGNHLPTGYHPLFHGKDHTTGNGKFMMVNGAVALKTIWQETVTVLPNTTYYFSAWGMNLNPAKPAQLQFAVNNAATGSIGDLGATGVPAPTSEAQVNLANWIRFYGTWTSGPTTTSAVINIVNLNTIAGGNDFGLDDISFGTLSTFIRLESATGTDAQTPCINTAITPIVYSVGSGASAPTITPALPAGLTSSFNGVLFTISGTPTVAGNYAYTITTTGSCQPSTASGTINVQTQTIALTSGSNAPVCINTALPATVYTVGGTAIGASITTGSLPAGVGGLYDAPTKTFNITGTPTVAGVFNFTIATTGTCTPATINGTITVTKQTITLNSANNNQTTCINSPIANIQYTIGGTGSGVLPITGLPAGVSGSYTSGILFISGTPTVAGTFNYTVTTSGTCAPATATGTISVTPNGSLTLTSGAGTNAQTLCANTALTNITYSVNNAAGATVAGLPAGVTGGFSGGVFTISGTATVAAGTYNYTVTTTGGCATGTATGSITVQSQTITLSSGNASPTICINTAMTPIVFTIGGTATGASISGQPAGVNGVISGNTFTISGTPSVAGPFSYTVTLSGSCATTVTATGTITVSAGAVGGTLTSVSVCSGTDGTLTLGGNSSNPARWEYSTDGTTWITTSPNNTTISQSFTNVTVPTQFRAVISNTCGIAYSSIAAVSIHNYWTGGTSIDWNIASNWSDGAVPTTGCDVYIPGGQPNQPTLSNVATITGLHIFSGAILTVSGTGKLQIAGSIANAGVFDVTNGTLEFNGSSQTLSGGVFKANNVKNLIVSSSGSGLSLTNNTGDTLNVLNTLTFGNTTADLTTNGNLTLKSTVSNTASVGMLASGNAINGDVTVERYINTGTVGSEHPKSWQLLAVPTVGQTINAAWQEGATASNLNITGPNPAANPHPGYGTMVTGTGTGFDAPTADPSIKVYDSATTLYKGPTSTSLPIYDPHGYFVFVRGDRSVGKANSPATPTTLRTKGKLFTPANPPLESGVKVNTFEQVGNPYASAIDMRKITLSGGTQKVFQVWDPNLGGGYGYGGFQTLTYDQVGDYIATPGGGNYSGNYNYIQSGQAFFVQAFGSDGAVDFNEAAKAGASSNVVLFTTANPLQKVIISSIGSNANTNGRITGVASGETPYPVQPQVSMLRTTLYGVNADGSTGNIADGTLNQFDNSFTNTIDGLDARKQANTGVNLGIKTAATLLAVERRKMPTQQDTIFLNLTGVSVQKYRFNFNAQNLGGNLEAFLEDSYLNTRTPININGSTDVDISIANVAGSYAANRFRIVFATLKVLPVTFTSLKAYQQDKNINIEWSVENEANMKQYEVEKSVDGNSFNSLAVQQPSANNGGSAMYAAIDAKPVEGYNYYRIRSVDMTGKVTYTNAVKVIIGTIRQEIVIYPNPITDGMIHLQLKNQPEGKYKLRLINKVGQLMSQKQITHSGGTATELLKWDYNLAHGLYQLEVIKPDGSVTDLNVMY